jgi:hypothetical protein
MVELDEIKYLVGFWMVVKCSIYELGFLLCQYLLPIDFVRECGQSSLDNLTCNVDASYVSKFIVIVASAYLKPSTYSKGPATL